MDIYEKNGKAIPYEIHKKKIKNTYFRIKDGYLKVTTSSFSKKKLILTYIDLKFDQIYDKLEKTKQEEPINQIMLWGQTYELKVSHGRFKFEIDNDEVLVSSTKTDVNIIKKQIYLGEMKNKLLNIQDKINQKISTKGLKPCPFKLKYLKSKFGSYHRKNKEITLNTFLARLNPIYLEYVIYHEYAHAIVFNHSKDFYNLLSEFMPNHRVYQKDLKRMAII